MADSIHTVLNLPAGGSSIALGPVKIACKYPADSTPKGIRRRNIQVSDASGTTKMTLWREAADLPLVDGSTVIFKGEIKPNDYNGNITIAGTKLTFQDAVGPTGGAPAMQPSSGGHAAVESKIDMVELADQMASFTVELEQALINKGIQKEVVNKIIERAPEWAAVWWFGEKSLNMPKGVVEDDYCPE